MRVTEGRMIELASTGLSQARNRAADAGEVMTTGARVQKPSDDLTAWVDAQRVSASQAGSTGRGSSVGRASDHLQLVDGSLSAIGQALTRVRELAIQGVNGTLSPEQRASIGDAISGLRDLIVGQANARDSDGEFLLAGSRGTSAPFSSSGVYGGDGAARSIEVSPGQSATVTVPGSLLTAAAGVDVIGVVNTMAAALQANDTVTATASLADLVTATAQVAGARSEVGDQLAALTQADDARTAFEVKLASEHSRDVEADPIAAASKLQQAKNALESAQAVAQQMIAMTAGGLGR